MVVDTKMNWGKNQRGPGVTGSRNFCCSLLHPLPYFPPSVWINTYSLPFVLFNLLYFPPTGFMALQRCISTRLLTSHPKPAALPPDGNFHTWIFLTLPFCHFPELNGVPREINYTECRVMLWSLFFLTTLKKFFIFFKHLKEQLSTLPWWLWGPHQKDVTSSIWCLIHL